jgi:hypothetical protein
MNSPEIDRQFLALTDNLRFETDGLREYEDVTTDLWRLLDDFGDHLVALDGFDPNAGAEEMTAILHFLHVQLTKSLESLSRIMIGDKFITNGQGIIIHMDEDGIQHTENLADDVRLHGTIGYPYVIEVPLSLDTADNDTIFDLPDSRASRRPGVVLEVHDAAIETVDPHAPYTTPEPVDPGIRVFLPIVYPELRVNRQIPRELH